MCRACGVLSSQPLCVACAATCAPVLPIVIGSVVVRSAYEHSGAPRRLVHRLKYGELVSAATVLAGSMIDLLPPSGRELIPAPRAVLRRWRHGIDPAEVLARALAKETGLPVRRHLVAALWWPRHATGGASRSAPGLRLRGGAEVDRAVLVDDVCTTGATLAAAIGAIEHAAGPGAVVGAVTATRAAGRKGRSPLLNERGGLVR